MLTRSRSKGAALAGQPATTGTAAVNSRNLFSAFSLGKDGTASTASRPGRVADSSATAAAAGDKSRSTKRKARQPAPVSDTAVQPEATTVQAQQDAAGGPAKSSPKKKPRVIGKKSPPPKAKQPSIENVQQAVDKAARIGQQLDSLYPKPPIPLNHETAFQLLVCVILSAQTTDKKVNEVTPALFAEAPDAAGLAALDVRRIEHHIREIGLAPTKSKNLSNMAKMLMEHHGGQVPDTFEALEALPGVGHKTASVIMAQAFGHPSFPVDTHIHRLAQRWGLTLDGKTVEQTEADLKVVFPQDTWIRRHLQIIYFGREHCPAQRHDPTSCSICSWAAVPPYDKPGASPARPGQQPRGQR